MCDHDSDYPQAAALTGTEQGSLIRRSRRGDNVSAFIQKGWIIYILIIFILNKIRQGWIISIGYVQEDRVGIVCGWMD